ncbi:hypothetical protein ACFL3V_06590 [Nanoarchaeota archaeon]
MMEDINLAEKAYLNLFPTSKANYGFKVKYTGRLKDFGAYVSLSGGVIEFRLSRKWYAISPEIQMGCMQELLVKLMKVKKESMYIDLYNGFVKNLHVAVPKDNIDPLLRESFDRVNERYFLGLVECPNLKWGRFATTTFGSYDFKNDTITMSSAFKEVEDIKYVDYIMFHEMLHKQRKFFKSGARTYYHDARFKRLEKVFEDGAAIEKELGRVVGKEKAKAYYRQKRVGNKPEKKKGIFGWF